MAIYGNALAGLTGLTAGATESADRPIFDLAGNPAIDAAKKAGKETAEGKTTFESRSDSFPSILSKLFGSSTQEVSDNMANGEQIEAGWGVPDILSMNPINRAQEAYRRDHPEEGYFNPDGNLSAATTSASGEESEDQSQEPEEPTLSDVSSAGLNPATATTRNTMRQNIEPYLDKYTQGRQLYEYMMNDPRGFSNIVDTYFSGENASGIPGTVEFLNDNGGIQALQRYYDQFSDPETGAPTYDDPLTEAYTDPVAQYEELEANSFRPPQVKSQIQGDLAKSYAQMLEGDEAARDYFTTVSSGVFERYQNAYAELDPTNPMNPNGYDNLAQFCLDASAEEFWDFAQFAHSMFGMYSGEDFENPDGTLDEALFMNFYNECKRVNNIADVYNAQTGQMNTDAIGVFVTDYQTALGLADLLARRNGEPSEISSADIESLANTLWATKMAAGGIAGDGRFSEPTKETIEDAYRQMGDQTRIGTYRPYAEGGAYNAQRRLPSQVWDTYNGDRNAVYQAIVGEEDTDLSNYLNKELSNGNAMPLIDTMAYLYGYGFDRQRS